jgi:two-component system, NarL family, nitrate/nitrite response regulator NarL
MSPVRVLIVADDPLARAGLVMLLADLPELLIVGRVSGSDDLKVALDTHQPDVVLWDMGWKPEVALSRFAEGPGIVLVVALLNDEADAAQAWAAGARGLLSRNAAPGRIASALVAVAQSLVVLDPDYGTLLAAQPARAPGQFPSDESPLVEELTPRELEVLRLLAEGLPNKTIAQRLDISEHTVKFHVNAVLGKLGVGSRTEAVVRATRLGLIFL